VINCQFIVNEVVLLPPMVAFDLNYTQQALPKSVYHIPRDHCRGYNWKINVTCITHVVAYDCHM